MELHWGLTGLALATYFAFVTALSPTLLEDVKAADERIENNKVKRAHSELHRTAEPNSGIPITFYNNPTAVKRAPSLKAENVEEPELPDWSQEQRSYFQKPQSNLEKDLYSTDVNPFEDKSVSEYEKGFHYGTNKARLDEQLENAILKSEIYGDPGSINQYRYYGGSDEKRKKRSEPKHRMSNRFKREVELSPEDVLTLLSLWEAERQRSPNGLRTSWPSRYSPDLDDNDREENEIDEGDENWLEGPVYPGARSAGRFSQFPRERQPYYNSLSNDKSYDAQQRGFRQWNGFSDNKKKRFMVSRKRSDPTRELRYLNGPSQNRDEMYTLAQLLGGMRRDPIYHRGIL